MSAYKKKRDKLVEMIAFNRDDLGRTIISGLASDILDWHEKELASEYNKALEDAAEKVNSKVNNKECKDCVPFGSCGCAHDGRNEGLSEAIEELQKLKK